MTLDIQVITRRLSHIITLVEYLEHQQPISITDMEDPTLRLSIERCIQVIAQSIIDIASSILANLKGTVPNSYREAITSLGLQGIIERPLAQRLADLISMRNILVHEYIEIDINLLAKSIPMIIEDSKKFVSSIKSLLENHKDAESD